MKTETTPLSGVINETLSSFGKPISVREVLRQLDKSDDKIPYRL